MSLGDDKMGAQMKRTGLLVVLFFILATVSVSAQVAITPSNPADNNNLVCGIQGANPSAYLYQWFKKNGNGWDSQPYSTTVPYSATSPSDTWRCQMFVPPTPYTGLILIGEAYASIPAAPPVVQNQAPIADFTSNAPQYEGSAVSFTDASTDPDGTVSAWTWSFGDGSNSNTKNPSHTYTKNKTYAVTFSVQDNSGTGSSTTKNVVILDQKPNAGFSSVGLHTTGVLINFSSVTASYDPIVSTQWNFGDGNFASGLTVSHAYSTPGTYLVNITVTDNDGSIASKAVVFTINNGAPVDVQAPVLNHVLDNIDVENGTSLYYDINASDNVAVDGYSVNDTGRFTINKNTGVLQSIGTMTYGEYSLMVSVNDTSNNVLTAPFTVTIPNLNGTVRDVDTGQPVKGANISFYKESDSCKLDDVKLKGSCTNYTLQSKPKPDRRTDILGRYRYFIRPNIFYHMFIRHSKQVDYDLYINSSKGKKLENNVDIKENQSNGNVNFEGHILYSGRERHGNKYVLGDILTFIMFGNNQGSQNVTVTFLAEKHIGPGSGANGPWVLNGSFANVSQTLMVPGNTIQKSKLFNITLLPPAFSQPGKYDIHVMLNNSGKLEKWHKIGEFFVEGATNAVNDTIALNATTRGPPIFGFIDRYKTYIPNGSINKGQYVNDTFNVTLKLNIPPQTGTIASRLFSSSDALVNPMNCTYGPVGDEVTILAPQGKIFLGGQNRTNKLRMNITNARGVYCTLVPGFVYAKSDKFKINITLKEQFYGAVAPLKTVNASIWATEQMARDIYYDITQIDAGTRPINKPVNFTGFYRGDKCSGLGGFCADSFLQNKTGTSNLNLGYYRLEADLFSQTMGFEYRSKVDGYDQGSLVYPDGSPHPCENETGVTNLGVTNCERDGLNVRWHVPSPDYTLVVDPTTSKELAQKVAVFATWIVINNSITTP